jgi:RNA polymerase sigma-70 factor, ECF subfamily
MSESAGERTPARAELERLMSLYQRADAEATASLIAAVSPMLYRFLWYKTRSREDAADLLQETWLQIHKSRDLYRPGQPVLPWLYAIARHVQVDGYRRRSRIRSREQGMDTLPDVAALPRADTERPPSFETLVSALPESQREVITMMKVAGMSLEEVARATASSVGSVKQKVHRAYEKLRHALRSADREPAS